MLSIIIVTLLINSNVIPRIQAEEQEDQKAQLNGMQTLVYEGGSVIEALKVQKRDTLNIVPESYVEQTNNGDKLQNSNRLRQNLTFDNFMKEFDDKWSIVKAQFDNKWSIFNAPANRTGEVNYIGSRVYQRNISYPEINGKPTLYGSQDVQISNTFSNNPNGTNLYGSILVQENNTYRGKNENSQYGASITQIGNRYPEHPEKNDIYTAAVIQNGNTYPENSGNKTLPAIIINQSNNIYPKSIEANKDALKPVIHQSGNFYPSSNDSESKMNTKNNTENQFNTAEQNATDSQGNSSSTNYDSSSHIENKTLYNKESEAYANKHTAFNRQISLSSNVFYSLSYSLIILVQYSLFQY